jgi:hypothetical protein
MNTTTLILIALRAAALGLSLVPGRTKTADNLYLLADVIEAGKLTDDHMREVAEKLKAREINDDDWADVMARIEEHSARLQASGPAA